MVLAIKALNILLHNCFSRFRSLTSESKRRQTNSFKSMCAGEREMNDEKNQRFTEKNIIHLERQNLYIFFQ